MLVPAACRKLLLVVHVGTSVGFPGAVAGFLALAIVGATSGDAVVVRSTYIAMAVMTWDVIVPLAAASLLIGIVESLVTPVGAVPLLLGNRQTHPDACRPGGADGPNQHN